MLHNTIIAPDNTKPLFSHATIMCSVATQTCGENIEHPVDWKLGKTCCISRGTGTDLNAIGNRKTLTALLKWALAICNEEEDCSVPINEESQRLVTDEACLIKPTSLDDPDERRKMGDICYLSDTLSNVEEGLLTVGKSSTPVIGDECSSEEQHEDRTWNEEQYSYNESESMDTLSPCLSECKSSDISDRQVCDSAAENVVTIKEEQCAYSYAGEIAVDLGREVSRVSKLLDASEIKQEHNLSDDENYTGNPSSFPCDNITTSADNIQSETTSLINTTEYPSTSTITSATVTDSDDKQPQRTGRQFDCKHCNKKFKSKQELNKHLLSISIEGRFKCEYCDLCFRTKQQLKAHTLTKHRENPFLCDHCSMVFKKSSTLRTHMIKAHSRQFKCPYCESRFRTNSHLKSHTRSHDLEKPGESDKSKVDSLLKILEDLDKSK